VPQGRRCVTQRGVYYDETWVQLIRQTDPLGQATTMTYTPEGYLASITDPRGRTTTFAYDAAGRLVEVRDPQGNRTRYEYGPGCPTCGGGGRLTAIVDALGHRTEFAYDGLGRLTEVRNARGIRRRYEYDVRGRLVRYVNGRGQTVEYAYDGMDRLVRKTLRNADGSVQDEVTYAYDGLGHLTAAENGAARLEWDRLWTTGAPARERILDRGHQPAAEWQYRYAWYDNGPTGGSLWVGGQRTLDLAFWSDGRGRIIRQSGLVVPAWTYVERWKDYNRAGEVVRRQVRVLFQEAWAYDGAGRLATKTVSDRWGRPLRRWQYAYDAGGNIGSKTTEVYDPPGNRVQAWTAAYGYDGIDQLTGVQYTGQVPAGLVNEWYAYDAVGNRVASYLSGAYVYNELNQLTEDADWVYGYDADGNLVERVCRGTGTRCEAGERWGMEYDAENTLRRVQKWGGGALALEVAYVYDPLGRRIERRVVDGSQGTTAIGQYLYRDEDVVAEFRVDPTTGSRVLEKLYFHGNLGVDDPVAMFRCVGSDCRGDYQWYFYGKDHLNTVEAVWDSGTRPAASYAYSAFGLPSAPPSPLQPFTFTSREWEGEIGDLVFFRRRMYDSRTGRFTGEDPTGIPYLNHRVRLVLAAETDVQRGLWAGVKSAYAYVANRPLIHVDPWGRAYYGIWCGPGPELAEGVSACSPPSQQVPGFIDPADACCKQHDCDYEKCGVAADFNTDPKKFDCKKCETCAQPADKKLCDCLSRAPLPSISVDPEGEARRALSIVTSWACCMARKNMCVPKRGLKCIPWGQVLTPSTPIP